MIAIIVIKYYYTTTVFKKCNLRLVINTCSRLGIFVKSKNINVPTTASTDESKKESDRFRRVYLRIGS